MLRFSNKLSTLNSHLTKGQAKFLRNALLAFLLWFLVADIQDIHFFLIEKLAIHSSVCIEWFSGILPDLSELEVNSIGVINVNIGDSRTFIQIGTPCDGWEIYYLCAAFIFIFPSISFSRKLIFSSVGILTMYFTNVLRIAALFFFAKDFPDWFQFFHHTVFQFIVYVIMFIVWILYLRGKKLEVK